MNSNDYKIVVNIVFPDGDEEYVIWEPLMYGEMIDRGIDFNELFYNSPDAITTPPLEVHILLYHNPTLTTISQNTGSNKVIRQLLLGRKICLIKSF
jgi:hypothetical protein